MEPSTPEHYERQTVLMWGTTTSGSVNSSRSSANRSPATTPTSNGLFNMKQQIVSPNDHQQHSAQSNAHLKWTTESNVTEKDIPVSGSVPIFQLHAHQTSDTSAPASAVDVTSMYAQISHSPHLSHHSTASPSSVGHIITSPEHNSNPASIHHSPSSQNQHQHVSQQTIGSCEVWSPAYSHQYFTYHHAPQHANTQ